MSRWVPTRLVLTKAADTFSGSIAGAGGVTLKGGKETLNGKLSYAGQTTVDAGTLTLSGTATSIASLSGASPGVLSFGSGAAGHNQTLTISNASGIFHGTISGGNDSTTKLNIAGGNEALTGAVTILGTTTVSAGATLQGLVSFAGSLTNNGTVKPFDPTTPPGSPGKLMVGGSYSQDKTTGALDITIGGTPASGKYGKLAVSGAVALAGALDVDTVNGFHFSNGSSKYDDVLTFSSRGGTDFTSFLYNGMSCTAGPSDTWSCASNLTFTEIFDARIRWTCSSLRCPSRARLRSWEPPCSACLACGADLPGREHGVRFAGGLP